MTDSVLLAALLTTILLLAGTGAARWLQTDDGFSFAGIAVVIGPAAWMVLINALGFFLPVTAAAWTGLGILCLAGIVMHTRATGHIGHPPPRWAAHIAGVVIALCAFAGMRFIGSDPWSWQHFPLAGTIAAGNLPPVTPIDPAHPLAYHYGPQLLAAAFSLVTHASLAAGFWSHPIIGSAGVILCAAGLTWRLTASWRAAVLGGVLALMGGGLSWLAAGSLITDLWTHFITGPALDAPFRNLTMLFDGNVATGLLPFFGHRSTAMGYPIVFALLLSIEHAMTTQTRQWSWIITGIVLTLALALTHELSVIALPCCMLAGAAALACIGKRGHAGRLAMVTLSIFIPGILLSLVQGGVLSHLGGDGQFSFGFDGTVTYTSWGAKAGLFDLLLWKDFGLPVLLLPLAGFLAWKRRMTAPFLVVLTGIVIAHLLVPFFVQYNAIEGEMRRLFYTAISIGAVLAGIAVDALLLSAKQRRMVLAGWLLIAGLLGSGIAYLPVRIAMPNLRFEHAPLFAGMPPVTDTQQALYAWVREHTTQDDWFFLRTNLEDFLDIGQDQAQQHDRMLFMTETGRFTLGQVIFWEHDPEWLAATKRFEAACDPGTFRDLNLTYLVVETPDREQWFREHCDAQRWESVYIGNAETNLPRVLRLQP